LDEEKKRKVKENQKVHSIYTYLLLYKHFSRFKKKLSFGCIVILYKKKAALVQVHNEFNGMTYTRLQSMIAT
jgi:hypothetical protein